MTEPLPDMDFTGAVTDLPALKRYNEMLIAQFRANAGELTGQLAGLPVLLLTTVGAKTGLPRTTPMVYLHDGDCYIVAASKAGAPTHPAWYHNLMAAPAASLEVGSESLSVSARIAEGAERARLLATFIEHFPIFGEHQRRTSRPIPLVVLERNT